jgi:putative methionine-R-sulfoxide reductase with GAF domain
MLESADETDIVEERARRIATAHDIWVAIASFAGSTGGGFTKAAGRSGICLPTERRSPGPGPRLVTSLERPSWNDDLPRRIAELAAQPRPRRGRAADAAAMIKEHVGARWVGIYSVSDGRVKVEAWRGVGPPAHPVFPADRGLTGEAIRTAEAVGSNDIAHDSRYLTNQTDSGSELIVPVLLDGEVVGTLDIERSARGLQRERRREVPPRGQALEARWR